MNRPDWKEAPDWAQYLAMDSDGTWWWFEYQPTRGQSGWATEGQAKLKLASGLELYLEAKPKEYALYKGEELLVIGTIAEIAQQTGVSEKSIAYYLTESYQKRLRGRKHTKNIRTLEPLDDDEEE